MHEYISKFLDLVEHAYTLTPTDPGTMILASNFIEGIMNPYIRNKLRSCKVSNLRDIFKFAVVEDQKQKIRALDFVSRSDTTAHCNIQAIKDSSCYKCGDEGHFIKDCPFHQNNPMQHNNPTPNHKHSYTPHSRSNSNNTDMLAPITQNLNNFLGQLKQLFPTSTSSPSTSSHHKAITTRQIDINISIIKWILNIKIIVIITDMNHTVKIHTTEHFTVDKTIGQGSMK